MSEQSHIDFGKRRPIPGDIIPTLELQHDGKQRPSSTPKPAKEKTMNKDIIEGNWKQLKGKVREQWGKLTDDDLDMIEGRREVLCGKIQERYGMSRDTAEKQLKEWQDRLNG